MHIVHKLLRHFRTSAKGRRAVALNVDVAILTNGDNASIAYLLGPALAGRGQTFACVDTDGGMCSFSGGSVREVVIARYLPNKWLGPLRQFRSEGGRVIYFMDDDLMDPAALQGLSRMYAKKIRTNAITKRAALESLCDEFWVGSPYLAEKYADWLPRLLSPHPGLAHLTCHPALTVCYHGTASHVMELRWLLPLMEEVHATVPECRYEVFGDHAVKRLYSGLNRVSVLHPMSWSNYLAYSSSVSRDIGLAPLLPGPFNAARGPTKFFDFVRMNAVGIYTDIAPYRGFIRDGVDGLLLPNDPALWASAIRELAADVPRRHQMAGAARQRALSMAWDARNEGSIAQVPAPARDAAE